MIRISYLLLVDGYISHPDGELLLEEEDWERLRVYHVGIGTNFIDCNASGGEPEIAMQILASKGARFKSR